MQNKNQHWIPQCYQKSWCDPECPKSHTPYVWLFTKDGTTAKKRAPKNIFYETDLYTVPRQDGGRDLSIEGGLAQLESEFVRIRDNHLCNQNSISQDDGDLLSAFVTAMWTRTPSHINHWKRQLSKPLEMMREWKAAYTSASNAEAKISSNNLSRKSMSIEELEFIVDGPAAPVFTALLDAAFPVINRMSIAILNTCDQPGFITSDSPCVLFDYDAQFRPDLLQSPVLLNENSELTLPISPKQTLLLNWKGLEGYVDAQKATVDEVNRKTRYCCEEYFVSNSNKTRGYWFENKPISKHE